MKHPNFQQKIPLKMCCSVTVYSEIVYSKIGYSKIVYSKTVLFLIVLG